MHNKILIGLLLIGSFLAERLSAGNDPLRSPFWAKQIEAEPGGKLILRPRLPYIEGLIAQGYTLVLNVPDSFSLSPMHVERLSTNKLNPESETIREIPANGKKRKELSCKFDFALAHDGVIFELRHIKKGVLQQPCPPEFKFHGTFDWTTFRKEIQVPGDVDAIKPMLIKWGYTPIRSGTLFARKLKIREADTGKIIYDFSMKDPAVMNLGDGQDMFYSGLSVYNFPDEIKVMPGGKYIVECEIKADKIESRTSIRDVFNKKGVFSRIFIFDIAPDIQLPDKLAWRIEDKDGKIHGQGEIELTVSKERCAPKTLDTSVWTCETQLPLESEAVQKLYIHTFYKWGLNTIEPLMVLPVFDTPLTKENLSIPLAQYAKEYGMKVRAYIDFMYWKKYAAGYLEKNPQFAAVDPQGKNLKSHWPICQTHCLEKANPWLTYYLEAVKKSIAVNKLDGVFYDYEINAAPFMKHGPKNGELPPDTTIHWYKTCMCERCRQEFQNRIKLDHLPSVEECCSDELYDKWTSFRISQNLQFCRMTRDAAKSITPDVTFAIHSALENGEFSRERYGVDWVAFAPYMDFAMQRYIRVPAKESKKLNALLSKGIQEKQSPPKMLFQLSVFPYSDDWIELNRITYEALPDIKNTIVGTVVFGDSFGWSFNGIWGLDDQLTIPVKEANAILAKYEDYFITGKRNDDIAVIKTGIAKTGTWQLKDRNVTFIFNSSDEAQDIVLKLKDDEKSFPVGAHDCYVHEW